MFVPHTSRQAMRLISTFTTRRTNRLAQPTLGVDSTMCMNSTATTSSITPITDCQHFEKPKAITTNFQGPNSIIPEHSLFRLDDRAIVVTGGGRGLGLEQAVSSVKMGAHVYCIDCLEEPYPEFYEMQERAKSFGGGSIHYRKADVTNKAQMNSVFAELGQKHQGLHGMVAAAGIQFVCPAIEMPEAAIDRMMRINYKGVYLACQAAAKQMEIYGTPGSIVIVGSMSGMIANKGLLSSVYNSSKAAVEQLARSLAMEWGQYINGKPIRVNVICPGNILTPMVAEDFKRTPELKEIWEKNNVLGRISEPHEFRGITLFLLSDASSFATGAAFVIDGGYTAR